MRLTRRGWRAVGARRARPLAAARADASSGRERRSRAADQPRASGLAGPGRGGSAPGSPEVAARSVSPAPSGANPGALALARGRRRLGARPAGARPTHLAVLPSGARRQSTPRTLPVGMQPTNAAVLAGVPGAWPASPARRSAGARPTTLGPGPAPGAAAQLAVLPSDARRQSTPRTLPVGMQPTNAAVLAGRPRGGVAG